MKTLTKTLVGLVITYLVLNWFSGPSVDVKPIKKTKIKPPAVPSGDNLWNTRRDMVRDAFKASWDDYAKNAWGYDVYAPIKGKGKNMKNDGPLGWIIVDSLDSLILMDLKDQLDDARSWVKMELNFDMDEKVHTFETTIRMLGGLLSAFYLTDDEVYSEKAVHLGNKLLVAFNTQTGLPASEVNLKTGALFFDGSGISTAEITTLQLEFKYLATITGEQMYWDAADKAMELVDRANNTPNINQYDGLVPILIDPNTGEYNTDVIRLGSRGDSYYEYLLKQYLQTNEEKYLDMYNDSFSGIKKHLTNRSKPNNLLFFGELERGLSKALSTKMDHLVCFFGGLFALGATNGFTLDEAKEMPWWDKAHEEQLLYGEELGKTCYHMYHDVPNTGLSPEIVNFNINNELKKYSPPDALWSTEGDFFVKKSDTHNLQRPETVETLYYLYKITGDIKYREWGWEIFENFVSHTGIGGPDQLGGYKGDLRFTTLSDVFEGKYADNMESFWLAETLKYFYLLFTDEDIHGGEKWKKWNMKNIVFNTEAHPLPRLDGVRFHSKWEPRAFKSKSSNVKTDNIKLAKDDDSDKIGKLSDFDFTEDEAPNTKKTKYVDDEAEIQLANENDYERKVIERNKKSSNEIVSKNKVAKPLSEQVDDLNNAQIDDIESIDDLDPALEAELF